MGTSPTLRNKLRVMALLGLVWLNFPKRDKQFISMAELSKVMGTDYVEKTLIQFGKFQICLINSGSIKSYLHEIFF